MAHTLLLKQNRINNSDVTVLTRNVIVKANRINNSDVTVLT